MPAQRSAHPLPAPRRSIHATPAPRVPGARRRAHPHGHTQALGAGRHTVAPRRSVASAHPHGRTQALGGFGAPASAPRRDAYEFTS